MNEKSIFHINMQKHQQNIEDKIDVISRRALLTQKIVIERPERKEDLIEVNTEIRKGNEINK